MLTLFTGIFCAITNRCIRKFRRTPRADFLKIGLSRPVACARSSNGNPCLILARLRARSFYLGGSCMFKANSMLCTEQNPKMCWRSLIQILCLAPDWTHMLNSCLEKMNASTFGFNEERLHNRKGRLDRIKDYQWTPPHARPCQLRLAASSDT